MTVSTEVCLQIVKRGFFVDWQLPPPSQPVQQPAAKEPVRVAQVEPEIRPVPQPQPQPAPSSYLESLAMRNAQVRSNFQQ
jgi:zona occludens toxin